MWTVSDVGEPRRFRYTVSFPFRCSRWVAFRQEGRIKYPLAGTLEEYVLERFLIWLRCALTAKPGVVADSRVLVICEVHMGFMRGGTVKSVSDVISGILNCVCPECGGRMGERGEEFRCQGECLTDWRQAWERASAEFGMRSRRPTRRI